MSTSGGHAPYGHRHVVTSAVSLAGVYTSHAKPVLAGVYVLYAGSHGRYRQRKLVKY